jgi:YidC/Oxa1 family membrane protein insertase
VAIGDLWTILLLQPMLNGLLLLYGLLWNSFGLAIVAFTIIVRTLMLPLTLKQLHAAKAMSSLQPKIQELQKKYGKNREELSKATMALYREHGVNPIGCAVPTLLQFPIWIGLYQSIHLAMADRPDALYELGKYVYSGFSNIASLIPINNHFLWLNLAYPDQIYLLAILVAGSTWVQQKMMTMPTTDPQQQQMNQMMGIMMPLMMGFFTISFPSGLALYWLISNLYSIVVQYFITGWGSLRLPFVELAPAPATAAVSAKPAKATRSDDEAGAPPADGARPTRLEPAPVNGAPSARPTRKTHMRNRSAKRPTPRR